MGPGREVEKNNIEYEGGTGEGGLKNKGRTVNLRTRKLWNRKTTLKQ